MKRGRFTEEQLITILRDARSRAKTADLARKYGSPKRRCITGR
jgi:hypothetical protein